MGVRGGLCKTKVRYSAESKIERLGSHSAAVMAKGDDKDGKEDDRGGDIGKNGCIKHLGAESTGVADDGSPLQRGRGGGTRVSIENHTEDVIIFGGKWKSSLFFVPIFIPERR